MISRLYHHSISMHDKMYTLICTMRTIISCAVWHYCATVFFFFKNCCAGVFCSTQVADDLSYVVMLRRKFGYLESIPGVLLPHPSSAAFPAVAGPAADAAACSWPPGLVVPVPPMEFYDPYAHHQAAAAAVAQMHIVPSMSSLEALLSKLPSVDPAAAGGAMAAATMASKEEMGGVEHGGMVADDVAAGSGGVADNGGESTSVAAAGATTAAAAAVSYYVNVAKPSEGF